MNVRLTHIDGKLPNLALMKLAHWHRSQGDTVTFSRSLSREMFEPEYDRVYGSAVFEFSRPRLAAFLAEFPDAIVGGTGSEMPDTWTVEQALGIGEYEHHDYSFYPSFVPSIGFTARGCRLRCGFCKVSRTEGKPREVNTIADIWRGDGHAKNLHLLDNDFFGQPNWDARIREIIDGGFKVCFNQGVNIRLIDDRAAERVAVTPYYDDQFKVRRFYTAWDNRRDEKIFFRGVDRLERAGVPPTHLLVYMLVGFQHPGERELETMERIMDRFEKMTARGIRPYPMVHEDARQRGLDWYLSLKRFQRWVIRKYYQFIPFAEYNVNARGHSFDSGQFMLAGDP